jgi:RNA polymerase sigma factor (sigma-70 family)
MNSPDFKKIEKRRKQFISKWKKSYPFYEDEAEEFASYCVEIWVARYSTNWNRDFGQFAIDYIRQRTHFSRVHKTGYSPSDAFDEYAEGSSYDEDTGTLSPEHSLERSERASVLRGGELDGRERCMLILHYEYGFTGNEIADCFGVTESRVCQILTSVQSCLQKKVQSGLVPTQQSGNQPRQSRALPPEVQTGCTIPRIKTSDLAEMEGIKNARAIESAEQEVCPPLVRSFTVRAF